MIGNKIKNQLELTTHYGFTKPKFKTEVRNKMANLKENAENYTAPETKNIADLDKVSVELELKTKVVHEGESDEFSYDFIEVEEVQYRVPKTVVRQLKVQLEANPELKFFSVVKKGSGMTTEYTVIPSN